MAKMYELLKSIKLLGGTGGTGTSDYENLENLPSINNTVVKGQMTGSDLGLANESDLDALTTRVGTNENDILSEQAKTTGMSEGGSDYITVGGKRVYVDSNPPTGARTGDLWIGG